MKYTDDFLKKIMQCGTLGYPLSKILNVLDVDNEAEFKDDFNNKESEVSKNYQKGIDRADFVLDSKLFEMAKIFRMKFWNKMYYLYFGGLFAYFRSACAIAIGMCFKAGIAAEIIGIPKGSIGEKLYNAKIYLETPDLFAWTFVIIAVSVLFEKIFQWLLSLLAHRLSVK